MLDACLAASTPCSPKLNARNGSCKRFFRPGKDRYNTDEVAQIFSASYTTEMEREVLHAALRGVALPVAQQIFAGNSVELF